MTAQKGVIIYMSKESDAPLLHLSLFLLFKNFNVKYRYPVVVFHDDMQKMTMSKILMSMNQTFGFVPDIRFETLRFELPPHVSSDESLYDPPLSKFWMGYRHMCRFHSGEIYKHPSLLQYDWYLRLDSDSFILSKIDYDLFDDMSVRGQEYGYIKEYRKEAGYVAVNLWETTKSFMRDNGITPASMNDKLKDGEWDWDIMYTNFEVAKFSFFRSKAYMSYYDYLDRTGMFYYNRWGDAPVHWFGVHMFLSDEKIRRITDITYFHKDWVKNTWCMDSESVAVLPEVWKNMVNNAASIGE